MPRKAGEKMGWKKSSPRECKGCGNLTNAPEFCANCKEEGKFKSKYVKDVGY